VDGETLVYDRERSRAHCLGPVAAAVWRHCDGRATAAEVAERVRAELDVELDAHAVWIAARRLERAHLLEEKLAVPRAAARREWLKQAAALGGLTVLSITAPLAVEAATCISNCLSRPNGACGGGLPCCPPATGNCCAQGGGSNCTCRTGGACGP
jgi:hypothetical protein